MTRTKITGLLLGILAVVSAGCQRGPELVPVEGTITKGGKPLAGVIVDFYPDSSNPGPRSTSAPTDKEGHYRLHSTRNGDDGAVVGSHRVCILDIGNGGRRFLDRLSKKATNIKGFREKVEQLKGEVSSAPRVPPIYGRPNETTLRVEVQAEAQVIDFDVKNTAVEVKHLGVQGK